MNNLARMVIIVKILTSAFQRVCVLRLVPTPRDHTSADAPAGTFWNPINIHAKHSVSLIKIIIMLEFISLLMYSKS